MDSFVCSSCQQTIEAPPDGWGADDKYEALQHASRCATSSGRLRHSTSQILEIEEGA